MQSRILLGVVALAAMLATLPAIAAPAPVIVYTMKTAEWHAPACRYSKGDLGGCPHILFEHPVIERAPTPAAAAALNRAVRAHLLRSNHLLGMAARERRDYTSVEEAMDAFRRGYEDVKPSPGNTFVIEMIVAIQYPGPAIVSVRFDDSSFFGCCHPDHVATFANFNATTGARITLDDVLVAGYRVRLTRIAENAFRAQHDIKPGMTLRDAGYSFTQSETFALADNFWFGANGVTFYYNPDEIWLAVQIEGHDRMWSRVWYEHSEVFLVYPKIRDLIRPDALLRSMR